VIIWDEDAERLQVPIEKNYTEIAIQDPHIEKDITLAGVVNRQDAWAVVQAFHQLTHRSLDELIAQVNSFPGIGRRFEQIAPNVYSDYAHTPPKIRGALQLAHEVAGDNVVVVYEGLHNTRQHFIKDELKHLFDSVKQLYIVPSYLAREDKALALLSPQDLKQLLDPETQKRTEPAALDETLKTTIQTHANKGDLVLCISAGGGGSLHEWLIRNFAK
jgi:UDP-N-acetylmuramate--alanine ligase